MARLFWADLRRFCSFMEASSMRLNMTGVLSWASCFGTCYNSSGLLLLFLFLRWDDKLSSSILKSSSSSTCDLYFCWISSCALSGLMTVRRGPKVGIAGSAPLYSKILLTIISCFDCVDWPERLAKMTGSVELSRLILNVWFRWFLVAELLATDT